LTSFFDCEPEVRFAFAVKILVSIFQCFSNLESVEGDNIHIIGDYAFARCTNLATVDLSSATDIGDWAFYQTHLTSVNLPFATDIGYGAFQVCAALTDLYLPASPPTLGSDVFSNTYDGGPTILTIHAAGGMADYMTTWGVAYNPATAGTEPSVCGFNRPRGYRRLLWKYWKTTKVLRI
jgi:hypothetical protein